MFEADTIQIKDAETGSNAAVIVRFDTQSVGLCITHESDGDLEIFMDKVNAKRLIVALKKAVGSEPETEP